MKSMTNCRFILAGILGDSNNASNTREPDALWAILMRSSTVSAWDARILVSHEDWAAFY